MQTERAAHHLRDHDVTFDLVDRENTSATQSAEIGSTTSP